MRKRIACVTAAILSISLGVSGCGLIPFEQDIPFLSSRAENAETEKKTEQQTIDEQDADTEKSTEDTQQDDGLNEGEQTDNEDTEEADEKQENPMEQAALMAVQYDYIEEILPKEIAFVSTQELVDMYPDLTPKEREYKIVKEKGAVFLMQVGKTLSNGERHDGRAPDYDDWELNGDILVYYPVLDIALELSSMGIRVDEDALDRQLTIAGCDDRRELPFQKAIFNKELPYTIGGGIGQSRICMFFLRKAHIGEVHVSLWPESITKAAEEAGVNLL